MDDLAFKKVKRQPRVGIRGGMLGGVGFWVCLRESMSEGTWQTVSALFPVGVIFLSQWFYYFRLK